MLRDELTGYFVELFVVQISVSSFLLFYLLSVETLLTTPASGMTSLLEEGPL